jgi:hypothetical protein
MSAAKKSLEDRVAKLEQEVANLRTLATTMPPVKKDGWKQIVGSFAGDPAFLEAMAYGREWRESFRPKPRKARKVK